MPSTFIIRQEAAELSGLPLAALDRGLLGRNDPPLATAVTAEDFVFVTDNRTDFRALYDVPGDVHPGLIFISGTDSRDHQQQRTRAAITWIIDKAAHRSTPPADLMVNKLVEMRPDETITIEWLPQDA